MRDPSLPILSDSDYTKINKELGRQEAIRRQAEMAMEAGFPCDEQNQACKDLIEALTKIKRVYFSERP